MRRIDNVYEALECLAHHRECVYNPEQCKYFLGMHSEIICDIIGIAQDSLRMINTLKEEE